MDTITDHPSSGAAASAAPEPTTSSRRRVLTLVGGGALAVGLAALPGAGTVAGKKKRRKGKGKGKGKKGGKGGQGNAGGGDGGGTNPPPPPPPASVEEQLLNLINAYRADNGKGQLAWQDQLGEAAQAHSDDMTANNFFLHTGSNGSTPRDRLTAAGYSEQATWGEIIYQGAPNDPSAQSAFTGWKNSPLHNDLMLSADFTHLGIGQATNNDGVTRWTVDFGSRP
jgi:hypothetical protein